MGRAPEPILKPKLASWLFARNIGPQAAAEALGCSKQTVLNITKAFNEPARTVPRDDLMERIVGWTGGEVTAADFYPPHLNGKAPLPSAGAQS